MNRPTILAVETLLLMSPYLIDTGRFLDAYTLFGTTIRVAQALGRKCIDVREPHHCLLFDVQQCTGTHGYCYTNHLRESVGNVNRSGGGSFMSTLISV